MQVELINDFEIPGVCRKNMPYPKYRRVKRKKREDGEEGEEDEEENGVLINTEGAFAR